VDRKSIFLALFIFIIIVFSLYFTLNQNPITPPEPEVVEQNLPEEELEDVSFSIFNERQEHELKLETEELENYKSQNRMELKPIEVRVYSLNGEDLLYTLRGDFGIYYSSRDYLELRSNVIIKSDQYRIETDQLDYYLDRNYLEGRGSVKIAGANFSSEAESFNSDLNLKNLKLAGNAEQAGINFNDFKE